jgi:hypothetical protein
MIYYYKYDIKTIDKYIIKNIYSLKVNNKTKISIVM